LQSAAHNRLPLGSKKVAGHLFSHLAPHNTLAFVPPLDAFFERIDSIWQAAGRNGRHRGHQQQNLVFGRYRDCPCGLSPGKSYLLKNRFIQGCLLQKVVVAFPCFFGYL